MEGVRQNTYPKPELGTILVIEDDLQMQRVLNRIFTTENYLIQAATDGETGLELFRSHSPVAVVLDLMLPQISGRELCQSLKAMRPDAPVIILSAISEVATKVALLELGADDYVTKPFSPRELLARVQAAIRRSTPQPKSDVYRFGECEIDFEKMKAKRAGQMVSLTSHEFKLLRFFVDNHNRVLTRELLLNQVWGYNAYPTTRTVDNQMLKLRQRLEKDPTNPKHLLTVYGVGYKFVP